MILTAVIAPLLRPGLAEIVGLQTTYGNQWADIFHTKKSELYQEIIVEMKYVGPADIKFEGQPGISDTMGSRFLYTVQHKRIYISYQISREAVEDNLYKDQFPEQAKSLSQSLTTTKNILAANVLNNAFNPAYPLGDGQPVCSTARPIDGGTYANAFGGGTAYVDFSEAGVEQMIIAIQQFKQQSGILCNYLLEKILVPPQLQFAVIRLLKSEFRTDTANNDISAIVNAAYAKKGYIVNQYLLSPNAWFGLTNSDGLVHFLRTPVETDSYADPQTQNLVCSASERYSFSCYNGRAIFGSPGV